MYWQIRNKSKSTYVKVEKLVDEIRELSLLDWWILPNQLLVMLLENETAHLSISGRNDSSFISFPACQLLNEPHHGATVTSPGILRVEGMQVRIWSSSDVSVCGRDVRWCGFGDGSSSAISPAGAGVGCS